MYKQATLRTAYAGGNHGGHSAERFVRNLFRKKYPKRSESAKRNIEIVHSNIMRTGVVKNTHKEYHPMTNRRFKVSEHRSKVISHNIVKSKGLKVGRRPSHKK